MICTLYHHTRQCHESGVAFYLHIFETCVWNRWGNIIPACFDPRNALPYKDAAGVLNPAYTEFSKYEVLIVARCNYAK